MAAYQPTIEQVALITRARTRDPVGNEGTYNATTRPTATDVEAIIDLVTARVTAEIGSTIPDAIAAEARATILLGTAAWIERSFFPEQNDGPDSQATAWEQGFRDAMAVLAKSAAAYRASASRGGGLGLGSMRVQGGTAASQATTP